MKALSLKFFWQTEFLIGVVWLLTPLVFEFTNTVFVWTSILSSTMLLALLCSKISNFVTGFLTVRSTLMILFLVFIFANFVPYLLNMEKSLSILGVFILPSLLGLFVYLFVDFGVDN